MLLHWSFDEGTGATTQDSSGNGLDGQVGAHWTDSLSGKALLLDGTSQHIVKTHVPEGKRFGTSSWTFMAWVKPTELSIEGPQNQRRIFSFGTYPTANIVIDLTGTGILTSYFCYANETGDIISTGASSSQKVEAGAWAQVAVVCDRENRRIWSYVNGYARQAAEIAADFTGDFVLGGDLTVGSPWHNYWGLMDEVRIYRRALPKSEVQENFDQLKEIYAVQESPEIIAAKKHDQVQEVFDEVTRLWKNGDFRVVRVHCQKIMADDDNPAHFRSYAHLRLAQSYVAEENRAAATLAYGELQGEDTYPAVHRFEAGERLEELRREDQDLPLRDPVATRVVVPPIAAVVREVFVAPHGSDSNSGSREKPLASLARARDMVRAMKSTAAKGAIAVTILPGEYKVTETFALTAEDSGTVQSPIVYRAAEQRTAVLYGGARLTGFTAVTDDVILDRLPTEVREKVVQCDLRARGITDYGSLQVRGFAQPPAPPTMELYFEGKPMILARWPNEGFVEIKSLIDGGSRAEGRPSVFEYLSDRHARWTRAKDPWLFGYFQYLWADATIRIAEIDVVQHTITTDEPYHYSGRGMTTEQGIIYYAFNLLEEIDQPGEWYLDRDAGMLYFYPPSDPANAVVEIGMLSTPMITADNVSNLRFEGLVFDLGRYNGIRISNSTRCLVAGCEIRRMAGNGITIAGGTANGILGCDIHTIGRRATEVMGGDRETLTPGGHFVENCVIRDFGRIDRTYTPAIQLEGVGNRVAHNLMTDCPSSVMRIEGNDHVIEFNEVRDAVQESDDQGAMELFRNATYRGVVFRYNRFTDIGKTGDEVAVHGQAGIRLDDAISGVQIYGNIFQRSANGKFGGIQMNSGRDNTIDNNLFIDCKQGISGGWFSSNQVWKDLAAGKSLAGFYINERYLSRYPLMGRMLEPPGINHLWRNVFYRCGTMSNGNPAYLDFLGNSAYPQAGGDFPWQSQAQFAADTGFHPIPVDEIGLYSDRYRNLK
jgi:hypothetical protein